MATIADCVRLVLRIRGDTSSFHVSVNAAVDM